MVPNNRTDEPVTVQAFMHCPNVDWLQSDWPRCWSNRLRQFFDEKCNEHAADITLRAELLQVLNVAEQVHII